MAPQSYKFVNTHAHEISGWKIISIIPYSRDPLLGGISGDVQSDISNLAFKNREQLEDFQSRILRLQHAIFICEETAYPTRLIFQYME